MASASGWEKVAVWTAVTVVAVACWILAYHFITTASTKVLTSLLNTVIGGGMVIGAYAAVALFAYLVRPEPLDQVVRDRDDRGASDSITVAVAGLLLVGLGAIAAVIGR